MTDTDTSPTPQSDVNQPDSRSTEGQNVHRWSISEMPRGLYDTSISPIELEEILANYIMPAHMHNGVDKRAEAKAAIQAWAHSCVPEKRAHAILCGDPYTKGAEVERCRCRAEHFNEAIDQMHKNIEETK